MSQQDSGKEKLGEVDSEEDEMSEDSTGDEASEEHSSKISMASTSEDDSSDENMSESDSGQEDEMCDSIGSREYHARFACTSSSDYDSSPSDENVEEERSDAKDKQLAAVLAEIHRMEGIEPSADATSSSSRENRGNGPSSHSKEYKSVLTEAASPKEFILHMDALNSCSQSIRAVVALSGSTCVYYNIGQQFEKLFCTPPESHADVVTGVRMDSREESLFYSSSLDGTIKTWDVRTGTKVPVSVYADDTKNASQRSITCFDISCDGKFLCGGTELRDSDAYLLFWDVRTNKLLGGYWDLHSNDVTQVSFHPNIRNILLSSGTDGLVNILDANAPNEDESLRSSYNAECSVKKVGWLAEWRGDERRRFYCVSDMEEIQFWNEDDSKAGAVLAKSDLGSTMGISHDDAYVIHVYNDTSDGGDVVMAGSNYGLGENIGCLRVTDGDATPTIKFEGNKQIVRCCWIDNQNERIITGGECGVVNVWKPTRVDPMDVQ